MKKLKPNQFKTSFGAVITEHPILFNGEMVQANLQDRKTQTRRIVKDEILQNNQDENLQEFLELTMKSCPFGMPGDLLWVRVQNISEEDAKAEGIQTLFKPKSEYYDPNQFLNYTWHGVGGDDSISGYSGAENAKESFQGLWYKINGADSWNSNPWVWVIQYRILSKTGKPILDLIEKNYKEVVYPPRVSEPLEGSTGEEVSHG